MKKYKEMKVQNQHSTAQASTSLNVLVSCVLSNTILWPSALHCCGFGKWGLFGKVHFLEIRVENLEILEILESPQTVENKGESDHFLEILEIAKSPLS